MTIVADTNVIIAAAVKNHPFHTPAASAIASALQRRELLMAQHALLESYSVLTRGPAPLRTQPHVAYQMLHITYGSCPTIGASLRDVWQFLRERDFRTAGGRMYDALIAVTAIEAGAKQL